MNDIDELRDDREELKNLEDEEPSRIQVIIAFVVLGIMLVALGFFMG